MSITPARATRTLCILAAALCLCAAAAHARQPGQQPQKPQPAPAGQRPPKKKIQASANFAQYAGRDASNRLIAGGATRDILTEAERHNREGRESFDAGRYAEAAASFAKLTALRPDSAIAFYSLGVANEAAGRAKDAVAAYRKAAELTNDTALKAVSLYNLGLAHAAAEQLTEAAAAFREAVRLKPDFADAHFNLGITLGRLEQYDEAVEAFGKAISLKPEHAEARFNLGVVHLARGAVNGTRDQIAALKALNSELAKKLEQLLAAELADTQPIPNPE